MKVREHICSTINTLQLAYIHIEYDQKFSQYIQRWATATLKTTSLPLLLFVENNSGAAPPIPEQK